MISPKTHGFLSFAILLLASCTKQSSAPAPPAEPTDPLATGLITRVTLVSFKQSDGLANDSIVTRYSYDAQKRYSQSVLADFDPKIPSGSMQRSDSTLFAYPTGQLQEQVWITQAGNPDAYYQVSFYLNPSTGNPDSATTVSQSNGTSSATFDRYRFAGDNLLEHSLYAGSASGRLLSQRQLNGYSNGNLIADTTYDFLLSDSTSPAAANYFYYSFGNSTNEATNAATGNRSNLIGGFSIFSPAMIHNNVGLLKEETVMYSGQGTDFTYTYKSDDQGRIASMYCSYSNGKAVSRTDYEYGR